MEMTDSTFATLEPFPKQMRLLRWEPVGPKSTCNEAASIRWALKVRSLFGYNWSITIREIKRTSNVFLFPKTRTDLKEYELLLCSVHSTAFVMPHAGGILLAVCLHFCWMIFTALIDACSRKVSKHCIRSIKDLWYVFATSSWYKHHKEEVHLAFAYLLHCIPEHWES